ncbi:putative bifunctional diguanylate cyclase/phosphodiesterase [Dethiosulfatarculus sandiegensis]|uniref:Diguanylate cyclase n=1 Tax=Dethiosulfatarculus sandiegensis TaxID=1429043 RepID=A0A0D2GGW3_9BACT|nr:bifunctional diguanylate cyclase/phosphodiesterase [Dethiosulfatarculus sandiegensis]KIX14167.1 diguanylate cyclase [Dethiosulfatarculus sandiegensis]
MSDAQDSDKKFKDQDIAEIVANLTDNSSLAAELEGVTSIPSTNSLFQALMGLVGHPCIISSSHEGAIRGPCLEANPPACLLLGYNKNELTGMETNRFIRLPQKPPRIPTLSESPAVFAAEFVTRNQEIIPVRLSCCLLSLGTDRELVVMMAENSGASLNTERERNLQAWAFDRLGVATAVTDHRGLILKTNQAFTQMTGMSPHQAVGSSLNLHSPDSTDHNYYKHVWEAAARSGSWQGAALLHEMVEGERFIWLDVEHFPSTGSQNAHCLATLKELEGSRLSKNKIIHLAHHDPLTGLPNRVLFYERLKQSVAQAKRRKVQLAVLFLDLDNFKTINDSLGHSVGDKMLKTVGARLLSCMRAEDTVSRLGGDEFVVVIPEIAEPEDAVKVARRIIQMLSRTIIYEGHELTLSASIGLTIFPTDGGDPETLIKNADLAMYQAKKQGKRRFQLFSPAMHTNVTRRLIMESNLRKGFQNQEFVVMYQPKFDLATGKVGAMEALVRWDRPDLGMVSPAEFIPLAEESGLIVPLGEWVLRQACLTTKELRNQGMEDLVVSINLSTRQLLWQHDLASMLAEILTECELPPSALDLELTESAVMHNVEGAIGTMDDLRQMGISLSLDDFGTGYSSLKYLKRFPIDVLKIDRSFVKGLPDDPSDVAIVISIISMARAMGLKVIAEGVETIDQLRFFLHNEVDEVQGFIFSRPLVKSRLAHALRESEDLARKILFGANQSN